MKILVIPDLHGKDIWKKLVAEDIFVAKEESDKIVFLGDYLDSFDHTNEELLNNLKDIIAFKKDNMDKVVLLWGNHEYNIFNFL